MVAKRGQEVTSADVHYETVAASQTAQVLGSASAADRVGEYLSHLIVIPDSVDPGAVSILDGSTEIEVFAGGTASVSNLAPFAIPLGLRAVTGPWKVTTGAAVSVIAVGTFG